MNNLQIRLYKDKISTSEAEDRIIANTYKFIIFLWNQNVHLRALSADDVTVEGFLAQVHLAAFCRVDGNGGNSSQNLQQNILESG